MSALVRGSPHGDRRAAVLPILGVLQHFRSLQQGRGWFDDAQIGDLSKHPVDLLPSEHNDPGICSEELNIADPVRIDFRVAAQIYKRFRHLNPPLRSHCCLLYVRDCDSFPTYFNYQPTLLNTNLSCAATVGYRPYASRYIPDGGRQGSECPRASGLSPDDLIGFSAASTGNPRHRRSNQALRKRASAHSISHTPPH